jgi:hypothetical protein
MDSAQDAIDAWNRRAAADPATMQTAPAPTYQLKSFLHPQGWHDTDRQTYEDFKANGQPVRIVYVPPVAAPEAPATTASASADTPELRRLVNEYRHACDMVQGHAVPQWRDLVEHINKAQRADDQP